MSKFAFLYERYIERFVMNLVVENESSHSLTDSSIDFEGYCLSLDNALFFRILSVSKNQYSTRYTNASQGLDHNGNPIDKSALGW